MLFSQERTIVDPEYDAAGGRTVSHLVVDAMNVIGSRPDGWWHDRAGAVRGLVRRLGQLAAADEREVTVVVDGRPLADLPEGAHAGVMVLYARRPGRDAADDRIVELLDDVADGAAYEVVTSDRALAERARACGAGVIGARHLLEQLSRFES